MSEIVYTYQPDAETRFTARIEDYPIGYHELIGEGIEIFVLDSHRNDYNHLSAKTEHVEAMRRFQEAFNYYNHDNYRQRREEAISRYLRLNGLRGIFKTLQGYSQSQWASVVVYSTMPECNEYLEDTYKTIDAWFKGDVYEIRKEVAKVFTAEDGERLTRWDFADSVGGFLLDSEEDLIEIAKDYFA